MYLQKIVTCYCTMGAGYNVDKHLDLCGTSSIYYQQLLCASLYCHSPSTAPQLLALSQLISQLMDSACPLCSAVSSCSQDGWTMPGVCFLEETLKKMGSDVLDGKQRGQIIRQISETLH